MVSRGSLARLILAKMGIRIAVIIALTTLVSYFHILGSMRAQALTQVEQYVVERSQREQIIFLLAEEQHALLKQVLDERLQALGQEDPLARFDSLFARLPDGSIRNKPEGFDGTRMPGVFVPRGVKEDADFRRRLVASYDVVAQYGPAFHLRFTDTFIMLPEGAIVIFWPEGATWCQDVEPTYSIVELPYFVDALPRNNPQRRTVWTGIYEDVPSQKWMVSVTTPLDRDGRHVATIGHDVLLAELMDRTIRINLPGTYNFIFRDNGELIAHPHIPVQSGQSVYNILSDTAPTGGTPALGTARQRAHLRAVFERVKNRQPDQHVLGLPEHNESIAVARLHGPNWNFVTVFPEQVVSSPALATARYVLLFGLASLVLELIIASWVLRQQITRPLLAFTQATDQVASGDFKVQLDSSRDDELGRLAHGFQLMASEVHRREETLERRVEERTRELKDVQSQLVETARRAGMAEVATNVLHNVGNVLNSVTTSATLAKEELGRLKVEQVSRLAELLKEHQGQLADFLASDERGRTVVPFLERLGELMRDKRQEISVLLDDVSRYTEHVESIVRQQQRHTRALRLQEPISLTDVVEDALRINLPGLERLAVKVERGLTPMPPVLTDKHKVLMILINLLSNAKYAMESIPAEQRRLTVKLEQAGPRTLRLSVSDTGIGIAPELLTRIFAHGFTTRRDGNGFGLHSSAIAAEELGGSLRAQSEGPGKGATFVLELPFSYDGPVKPRPE
jgi:C4-dicarboxylate-specific signal transduction histidine kinase